MAKKTEKPAETGISKQEREALERIPTMDDAAKLRTMRLNALRLGSAQVADAVFQRLVRIVPGEKPGSVEHDFWTSIHAHEEMLTEKNGKATRMSRTRQKATKEGVVKVLEAFATAAKPADGFQMLLDRKMPELTGEAVILRHPEAFAPSVVEAARRRLAGAGVDVDALPAPVA